MDSELKKQLQNEMRKSNNFRFLTPLTFQDFFCSFIDYEEFPEGNDKVVITSMRLSYFIDEFFISYTNTDCSISCTFINRPASLTEAREVLLDICAEIGQPIDDHQDLYHIDGKIKFDALLEFCKINLNNEGQKIYQYEMLTFILEKRCNISLPKELRLQTFFDKWHKRSGFLEYCDHLEKLNSIHRFFYRMLNPAPKIDFSTIDTKHILEIKEYLQNNNLLLFEQ